MKKGSRYQIIPKSKLKDFGDKLMLKQISYPQLLKHLSTNYKELEGMSVESLRKFMIVNKYVINHKSFIKINKNIQKQELATKKRKITVKNIKEELMHNGELQDYLINDLDFIKNLLNTVTAKKIILKYIIDILEKGK
jgi:hypothetical protein